MIPILTLIALASQVAPSAPRSPNALAALQPSEAAFCLGMPDLQGVAASIDRIPLMRLVLDPDLAAVVSKLSGGQVDLTQSLDELRARLTPDQLPPELKRYGLDRALMEAQGMSISLILPEDLETALAPIVALGKTASKFESVGQALRMAQWSHEDQEDQVTLEELQLAPQALLDGWGHPLQLRAADAPHQPPTLLSFGADGVEGGTGMDQDLADASEIESAMAQAAGRLFIEELGIEVLFTFAVPGAAGGLLQAASEQLPGEQESGEFQTASQHWRSVVSNLDSPAGAIPWWMASDEYTLAFGLCRAGFDGFAGRAAGAPGLDSKAEYSRALSSLPAREGQPIYQFYGRESALGLLARLAQIGLESTDLSSLIQLPIPVSGAGLLGSLESVKQFLFDGDGPSLSRTLLVDGQYRTDAFQSLKGSRVPNLLGTGPVSPKLLAQVDPEAGLVFAAGANIPSLFKTLTAQMGFVPGVRGALDIAALEAAGGFSLTEDLLSTLEPQIAVSVGLVKGIAVPDPLAYLSTTDAARSDKGLHGFLRALVALDPESISLKDRPYKKLPYYELKVRSQGSDAVGERPESAVYAFGFAGDVLFVAMSSKPVKDELRRHADGEVQPSPIAAIPEFAGGVQRLLYIDYPSYIDGLYGLVKGFGALAAGMAGQELPFDLQQLPDGELLTRHFMPAHWATRLGAEGWSTSSNNSFGPEIPLAILAGAFVAGADSQYGLEAPAPEPPSQEADDAGSEPLGSSDEWQSGSGDPVVLTEFGLSRLRTILEVYRWDRSAYPDRLSQLLEPSTNYPTGYLDSEVLPMDGWKQDFVYALTSEGAFMLHSKGPNGMDEQGQGDDIRLN